MRTVKVINSRVESIERRAAARIELAARMGRAETKLSLKQLTRPNSVSGTLRKAGAILLLSPDPLTDIPAIALIGASVLMRRREPLSVSSLMLQANRTLRELTSF